MSFVLMEVKKTKIHIFGWTTRIWGEPYKSRSGSEHIVKHILLKTHLVLSWYLLLAESLKYMDLAKIDDLLHFKAQECCQIYQLPLIYCKINWYFGKNFSIIPSKRGYPEKFWISHHCKCSSLYWMELWGTLLTQTIQ